MAVEIAEQPEFLSPAKFRQLFEPPMARNTLYKLIWEGRIRYIQPGGRDSNIYIPRS